MQELDEMDIEEDKRNLITREIDKFRDTYKVRYDNFWCRLSLFALPNLSLIFNSFFFFLVTNFYFYSLVSVDPPNEYLFFFFLTSWPINFFVLLYITFSPCPFLLGTSVSLRHEAHYGKSLENFFSCPLKVPVDEVVCSPTFVGG